jgi:hypothetical protein
MSVLTIAAAILLAQAGSTLGSVQPGEPGPSAFTPGQWSKWHTATNDNGYLWRCRLAKPDSPAMDQRSDQECELKLRSGHALKFGTEDCIYFDTGGTQGPWYNDPSTLQKFCDLPSGATVLTFQLRSPKKTAVAVALGDRSVPKSGVPTSSTAKRDDPSNSKSSGAGGAFQPLGTARNVLPQYWGADWERLMGGTVPDWKKDGCMVYRPEASSELAKKYPGRVNSLQRNGVTLTFLCPAHP